MLKRLIVSIAVALVVVPLSAQAQNLNRIVIPDVGGYLTLKCDLHVHTVFSDGDVWPIYRVQEAAVEGLDAIAVTDHVEYQPKGEYVSKDRNASFRIAQPAAADAGLILIPGAEITRKMPPGHLNALFVQDANALAKETWQEAVEEAAKQGAVIFWNHPGWEGQQPDKIARWYDEHTYLHEKGLLAGIEVANHTEYYPDVLTWCLEKKCAILGNSDTHAPIAFEFHGDTEYPRPMTLVFATERSVSAIKEAILARRTAVKRGDELIGEDQWLRRIFEGSISYSTKNVALQGRNRVLLRITNNSDIPYMLVRVAPDTNIQLPREIKMGAGQTALVSVRARTDSLTLNGPVTVEYEVTNLHVGAGKAMRYPLTLQMDARPKK